MLQQIQNADPTGEINPDSVDMLQLEGMFIEDFYFFFLGEYRIICFIDVFKTSEFSQE